MKMRSSIAITAAGLAACAQQSIVDSTPENPTAVFETVVTNGGIGGMFPFEVTQKRWVRPTMRRDEHTLKGTGMLSRYLVNAVAGGGDASITRLDEDKLWGLHLRKKEYTECPAHGCPVPPVADKEEKQREEQQAKEEPKQQTEPNCTTHVTSSNFNVNPTGEKKSINGFDASQYTAAWVLKLADTKKRVTTSTVSFDIWTTPLGQPMRDAFAVEQQFVKSYGAHARPELDRHRLRPVEVTRMMSAYLSSLRPQDRAQLQNAGKQLSKIQGHPVYTHIEWRMEGDACGDKGPEQKEQQSSSPSSVQGMLGSMAGSLFKKDEKPAGPPPILSFTVEVKQLGVQPVKDSVFSVPAGYKKIN